MGVFLRLRLVAIEFSGGIDVGVVLRLRSCSAVAAETGCHHKDVQKKKHNGENKAIVFFKMKPCTLRVQTRRVQTHRVQIARKILVDICSPAEYRSAYVPGTYASGVYTPGAPKVII